MMETLGGIAPTMAKSADAETGGADYSTTNIQVEGVDEADIVKSDGKYVYAFSKNRLVITDAYPIETASVVSKTELAGAGPQEMFVSGDKLLLFGYMQYARENDGEEVIETKAVTVDNMVRREIMPYPYYARMAVVQLYDISDRSKPVMEKEVAFEGSYMTSRLIGKNVYFVVNSWPHYWAMEKEGDSIIPLMIEDGEEKRIAKATEIGFLPPMPSQSFVTIASLNLESKELKKETIAGSAGSVYASKNGIYLASNVWLPDNDPPIIREAKAIIMPGGTQKTVVNKFGLSDGTIGFIGQGSVPGRVLNQFSMDEFEGNFRVATTAGQIWGGQSTNNVYILDKEMETIGKLEDLAPGERIYSARFMGNKGYMVTFKDTDPLFVIDLSDARNPRVLGKLKIPGYSDYLHPIDETHLIGIGKDTIESAKAGFAWYQGLKMAVFDVSNVSNPIEMHKMVIGDRGTDSYALHDHKAFLYDKKKELLVLPIMLAEIPEDEKKPLDERQMWPSYGEPVFQGAFVFRLTLENGFEERGRITHITPEEELKRGFYFGSEYSVKRSLYIGNVLYTLSEKMLKANALDTLAKLKELAFE